jgi:hypothetical protein
MQGMAQINTMLVCLFAVIVLAARASQAQIIYEPVQYQYGDQDKFFYGGTDPRVFQRAAAPADSGAVWGRVNGYDFASGDVWVHREVSDQPVRVFSDALPMRDATVYGFTATDAANIANAAVPRYFRKADVIAAARQQAGVLIVPARAVFPPAAQETVTVAGPTTRPLIILPAPAPAQNEPAASDKLVVASH